MRGVEVRLGGSRNERYLGLSDAGKSGLEEPGGFLDDPLESCEVVLVAGAVGFRELSCDDFCGVLELVWVVGLEKWPAGGEFERMFSVGSVYELTLDPARVCELGFDAG